MRFHRLLVAGFVAGLSMAAWATPIDPRISIDDGGLSPAIDVGNTFITVNGGGVFDYLNNTGQFITTLGFQTTVNTGIEDFNSVFSCASGFFLNCSFDYNGDTGLLKILFSGVNPEDHESEPECDSEAGEQEGIPSIQEGCTNVGHFRINLNDLESETGSWDTVSSNGQLQFEVQQINNTVLPEPSTLVLFGMSLLLIAGIARRRQSRNRA